ncbi:hypothetical protein HDU98_010465 [Podochytrium sp. JEL0797]|nr:hypothetical protein HDU98_010465 [Podochytrium sp. JEL0797]
MRELVAHLEDALRVHTADPSQESNQLVKTQLADLTAALRQHRIDTLASIHTPEDKEAFLLTEEIHHLSLKQKTLTSRLSSHLTLLTSLHTRLQTRLANASPLLDRSVHDPSAATSLEQHLRSVWPVPSSTAEVVSTGTGGGPKFDAVFGKRVVPPPTTARRGGGGGAISSTPSSASTPVPLASTATPAQPAVGTPSTTVPAIVVSDDDDSDSDLDADEDESDAEEMADALRAAATTNGGISAFNTPSAMGAGEDDLDGEEEEEDEVVVLFDGKVEEPQRLGSGVVGSVSTLTPSAIAGMAAAAAAAGLSNSAGVLAHSGPSGVSNGIVSGPADVSGVGIHGIPDGIGNGGIGGDLLMNDFAFGGAAGGAGEAGGDFGMMDGLGGYDFSALGLDFNFGEALGQGGDVGGLLGSLTVGAGGVGGAVASAGLGMASNAARPNGEDEDVVNLDDF